MPMNRYEIRNEYSLADPELYRAADKDDPEELLEGVAMAGLVGVLRQLGDLAEFAAEIFHDLHEEVMATAARGHSLMIRVQQLEADVPFIEKAFLAQTDHSSSFYNAGVDWHPSIRMDQNLVTQGDLPRFIMDSYEECRGPPRLFLLDKFDVAGAGACLKRYTDPSFFKVETSAMADADVQREKKIRKAKRKGPRGKYGETPEFLPASHAQLHQLFLEEPVETGVKKPAHRAKLKRRQNGFPFDLKTRNSYMEKLLTPSPEHKMLHEITASSPLLSSTNHHNESDLDVLEVRSVSPARESEGRKINPPPPDREDNMLNPPMNQTNDESTDIRICDVPSYLNIVTDGIPSTFDEENGEKEITIYGESKTDGSLTGYQSDDIASEIDNYVDAPSTMESEMDTDSELRMKNDFTSSYVKRRPLLSVRTRKRLHSQSSDSQSTGDLTISDEGSNSCKKEVSSFLSSDSPRTSADNAQSEKLSPEGLPSADIPEIAVVNASSSYQKTADEDFPADGLPEPVVSNSTFPAKDAVRNNRPDSEQLTSDLCSTSSIPTLPHYDSGEVVRKGRLLGPKSDGTASTSDDEGNKTNLIIDSPNSRSVSHSKSLSGDDSPRSLSGERLVDGENAPCMSSAADTICHTSDSSAASAYLLHEDDNDQEDINQFGDTTSTLNMNNVLSQNEIISNENSTLGKLDNEVTKLPNNFASDYSDTVHNGDNITLKVLEGEKQNDDLYNKDSNVISDAPNHFSCIMEASVGKEFRETSLTNAETVHSEDHYSNILIVNQIGSETLISSGIGDSSDFLESGLDAYETDFPVEAITINGIPELGAPKSCEVLGLQGTGITDDVTPNDLVAPESSFCMPQNLEDSAGASYAAENDGIDPDSGVTGQELTEIPSSADPKLLSEVHVVLNESDSKTDQSETAVMASPVPAGSDNSIRNASLPADLDKLVEEHIPCSEDSGLSELENDKTSLSGGNRESELVEEDENYLSGSHRELGSIEKVDEREAARLHFQRVCNADNIDYPESEVPQTVLNSYLDSEVEHSVDFVDAAQIQSHLEQSGLDTDKTSFKQSGVENQVCDANSFPIDCVTEETKLQEKTELPPNRVDQELPDSGEISSELSSLPVNHQQMLDHDNDNGHDNFACSIPLGNSPPSVSGLPGLRDYGIDVSAYPKGSLGSIFPPSNVFPVTNEINLDELPPLPPLPPLQWRMGKLQHASSTTEVDKIEHKEVFSHEILPPATSNVNSSLEQVNHSPIQNVPEITLKEANAEHGSASLEANSMHETINLPPKIENEQQQQLVMPTQESEVTLLAEEDLPPKIENKDQQQQQLVMPSQENGVMSPAEEGLPPQIEKEQQQLLVMPGQESGVTSPAEEGLPPKIGKEQQQLVMPTQESEVTLPAEEDLAPKIENEDQQQQLVLPRQESGVMSPAEEGLPPKIENEQQQQLLVMPSQESGVTSPAEEGLPPKIGNEQRQLVMPTQESGVTLPAGEDLAPKIENEDQHQQLVMPRQESGVTSPAGEGLPPKVENEEHQEQLVLPSQESGVTSPAEEGLPPMIENEEQQQQLVLPTQGSEVKPPAKEDIPPKIENKQQQQQLFMPTQESETSPAEDGVASGSRSMKLPQTCNPVIGSVAALDKSKLRKVTERVRPQIPKLDERDSLLEQIRAKSFNLKPAVASRPSTQRPQNNLNVAAILEKANAIRQALAGSDEDDEDNWSDS